MKETNLEKNKKNFENTGKNGTLDCEYIIEGQISSQFFLNEENEKMSNERIVINQFKKLVRVSLRNLRSNLYKAKKLNEDTEILSDVLEESIGGSSENEYDFLENHIKVLNFKMTVKNDLLYEVLLSMEQVQRDIIYLSICEDLNDREISEKLKMKRSNVQRIKQNMKKRLHNAMLGGDVDEN